MRTLNWMVLALLMLTMAAVAQQSAPAPETQQPASASQPPVAQPAAAQPAAAPVAPTAQAAPVTYTIDPIVISGRFAVVKDDPSGVLYRMTGAGRVDAPAAPVRQLP